MRIFGWGKDEARETSGRAATRVTDAPAGADGALSRVPMGARPGGLTGAATRFVERLLDVGIDGKGPFDSAAAVADAALEEAGGKAEQAIKLVQRNHRQVGALGGFVTGLGGFFAMPVALPANVLEFYVLATRMTAATAKLRGYDIDAPEIRSAVLLTLSGADSNDLLAKTGVQLAGGKLTALASDRLPAPALMVLNKAVAFQLLGRVGRGTFARLGRGVPLVGGLVGGGVDVYLLGKIAETASQEFPPVSPFVS
ncbi:MAG: EcsC family protein [Micrococcales bacterium]|nr:EcsC family protein [Micrococcales bacterium]